MAKPSFFGRSDNSDVPLRQWWQLPMTAVAPASFGVNTVCRRPVTCVDAYPLLRWMMSWQPYWKSAFQESRESRDVAETS